MDFLKNEIFSKLNITENVRLLASLSSQSINSLNDVDVHKHHKELTICLVELGRYDLIMQLSYYLNTFLNGKSNGEGDNDNNNDGILYSKYKCLDIKMKPYEFQYALANNGINGINNIICLQTGGGKTLVSAIICKYWYLKYKQLNKLNEFKVAFIVPTRNLADQQCNAYKIAFHEDSNSMLKVIDEKATSSRIAEYSKSHNILFLTAKKLVNTVEQTQLNIFDFKILIFDECHHTDELHPYSEIMNLYFNEKDNNKINSIERPIIIGLTASLGVGKAGVIENLVKFCANLDCETISYLTELEHIKELKDNVPSPNTDILCSIPYDISIKQIIFKIQQTVHKIHVKAHINGLSADKVGSQDYEQFLVHKKSEAESTLNRISIIACKYLIELNQLYHRVNDFPIDVCIQQAFEFLKETKVKQPEEIEDYCRQEFTNLFQTLESIKSGIEDNKKLTQICDIIKMNHKQNSRGLILVRTRYHTKALASYLEKNPTISSFIRVGRLTGQGSNEELCMSETQQRDILVKFRDGSVNLLVATDIAQEGLDVPECNYVIRYEFVTNEIGTVQSRGRARTDGSHCYLVTYEGSQNERRELDNREKEKAMYRALETWEHIPKVEFKKLFDQQQIKLLNKHERRIDANSFEKPQINDEINVLCRNCSNYICHISEVGYREPSYYCIADNFEKKIKINHLKYSCLDKSCENELGMLVVSNRMRMGVGYMLDIKSIKFQFGDGTVRTFKQWSKFPYKIAQIQ